MTPTPLDLQLSQRARELHVRYSNDETFTFTCYFLRQHSPSAEPSTEIPTDVNITAIDPVGHYGIKLTFDDGHNTGIYSWDLLYELGKTLV